MVASVFAALRQTAPGQYSLEGSLSLERLAALLKESVTGADGKATVDLSGLVDTDSSAAALMVHWSRRAAKSGEAVSYENCPEKLLALLDLYDLPAVLGL